MSKYITHRGAGPSETWDAQAGPDPEGQTHWFNVHPTWVQEIKGIYDDPQWANAWLPYWWANAIRNPGEAQMVSYQQGQGAGGSITRFAYYDPVRNQILAGTYECPMSAYHHLYETCNCCGQYG